MSSSMTAWLADFAQMVDAERSLKQHLTFARTRGHSAGAKLNTATEDGIRVLLVARARLRDSAWRAERDRLLNRWKLSSENRHSELAAKLTDVSPWLHGGSVARWLEEAPNSDPHLTAGDEPEEEVQAAVMVQAEFLAGLLAAVRTGGTR